MVGGLAMVVLGVVTGLVLFALIAWWWLRRKLTAFGRAVGDLTEALANNIPPFQINLQNNKTIH